MTIGIDLRILAKDAHTGVEEYAKQLLSFLLPRDPSVKYKIFYNAYHKNLLDYDWIQLENIEVIKYGIPNKFLEVFSHFGFPKIDKLLNGIDILFQPHFLPAALSKKCKRVITFHDLSFERYPEFFSWRKKLWHKRICPRRQARGADKIIAISESTRNDLINLYNIKPEKIRVIYSGIDLDFFADDVTNEEKSAFRKRYNIPENFILFLGTIEPRKNVLGAVKALEVLKDNKNFADLKLVVAGSCGWLCGDLFKYLNHSRYKSDIIFPGPIIGREKKILYKLAKVFVFPSFFEGFGFPPLEAMACGTPVVTSNVSSLPEVIGEGAIMVDPKRINEIADVVKALLEKEDLRAKLIERGRRQAQKFSWQRCAEETLEYILG